MSFSFSEHFVHFSDKIWMDVEYICKQCNELKIRLNGWNRWISGEETKRIRANEHPENESFVCSDCCLGLARVSRLVSYWLKYKYKKVTYLQRLSYGHLYLYISVTHIQNKEKLNLYTILKAKIIV